MHQSLIRFGMEGQLSDTSIPRLRTQFEAQLIIEMREAGFCPALDFGPFWSTSYDPDKDTFVFKLSIYGVHVGRRVACQTEGVLVMDEGMLIPRNTPPSKSSPSSEKSE